MSRLTIEQAISHAIEVAEKNKANCERNTIVIPNRWISDAQCAEEHEQLAEWLEELKCYKDLEDQLEKLYGDRLSLDKVVENLNRVVQNGEEKLDYARILTNAEAEKWDRWKYLEEQGRLVELPCKVGDYVYKIHNNDWKQFLRGGGMKLEIIKSVFTYKDIPCIGTLVFLTKEEAEAKLAEVEGEL